MFLETFTSIIGASDNSGNFFNTSSLNALLPFLAVYFLVVFIFSIGMYIYISLAFVAIAKKAKHPNPNLAWLPVVGSSLITSQIAKMPWWPILLIFGMWIPFFGIACIITFIVFSTIWMWKTFEKIGKPGAWAIIALIPFINIAYFIFLGVAAWGKK
jgi:hypothetical protein